LSKRTGRSFTLAYPAGSYNDPRMPLMYAIRAGGIDL